MSKRNALVGLKSGRKNYTGEVIVVAGKVCLIFLIYSEVRALISVGTLPLAGVLLRGSSDPILVKI